MTQLTGPSVVRGVVERSLRRVDGEAVVDADGDFVVHRGDVTAWVRVVGLQPDVTVVVVFAVLASGVERTDEAARYLASQSLDLPLCHVELHGDGHLFVASHSVLGEYLSAEELRAAVDAVTGAVRRYGPVVRERFGGTGATATGRSGVSSDDMQTVLAGMAAPQAPTPRGPALTVAAAGTIAAGVLARLAFDATHSWWLTVYAFLATALVAFLVAGALVGPARGPALAVVGAFVACSLVVLAGARWWWDAWWLAVVLAACLGPILAAALVAPFLPDQRPGGGGRR